MFAALVTIVIAARFSPELLKFPALRADAPAAEDLVAFHRAGEMARGGRAAAAYDPNLFRADLADHQQGLLWLNPPHALLLIAPATMLPYGLNKVLWLAAILASFISVLILAGARANRLLPFAILSPAMLIAVMLLQLGSFIALGLAAALVIAPKRPVLAGVILALLTMKPQYGLMAPIFLAATGQWRAVLAAAVATALLIGASAAIFGVEVWAAFLDSIAKVHVPFARRIFEGAVNFSHTAGKLGAGDAVRAAAQVAGVVICGTVVWIAAKRLERSAAVALTLLFSLAAAPSAWIYDWPFVVAALALVCGRRPWPAPVQAAAAAAWFAPITCYFADNAFTGLVSPLALYALCAASAIWLLNSAEHAAPKLSDDAPSRRRTLAPGEKVESGFS